MLVHDACERQTLYSLRLYNLYIATSPLMLIFYFRNFRSYLFHVVIGWSLLLKQSSVNVLYIVWMNDTERERRRERANNGAKKFLREQRNKLIGLRKREREEEEKERESNKMLNDMNVKFFSIALPHYQNPAYSYVVCTLYKNIVGVFVCPRTRYPIGINLIDD